jgi:anti-sigma factor RsiW
MNCSRERIESYLDDELDATWSATVEDHLATCADCSALHERLTLQKAAIREQAHYYHAPPELRQSVRAAVAAANPRPAPWRGLAIAASILLAASLGWNIARLAPRPGAGGLIAQAIVTDHVRSLLGTHLLDVPSTDQHTVKPWFNGKLDYAPEVKDLAAQGFPLIGGRIEYLDGRNVAALVYRRRQHVINLYTWPAAARSDPDTTSSQNGYNLVHWTSGAMTWWAVSDVNPTDLQQFKSLLTHPLP